MNHIWASFERGDVGGDARRIVRCIRCGQRPTRADTGGKSYLEGPFPDFDIAWSKANMVYYGIDWMLPEVRCARE